MKDQAYTILQRETTSLLEGYDDLRIVRHKFNWAAFFFAPIWLCIHALWKPLFLTSIAIVLINAFGAFTTRMDIMIGMLIMLSILVACEAPNLLEEKLIKKGYRPKAVITASGKELARARFVEKDLAKRVPEDRIVLTQKEPQWIEDNFEQESWDPSPPMRPVH